MCKYKGESLGLFFLMFAVCSEDHTLPWGIDYLITWLKQVNKLSLSIVRYQFGKKSLTNNCCCGIQNCSSSKPTISPLGSLVWAVCQTELFTLNGPLHRHPRLVFQRSHTVSSLCLAADWQHRPASCLGWSPLATSFFFFLFVCSVSVLCLAP